MRKFTSKYTGPWLEAREVRRLAVKTGEWRFQRPKLKMDKCCQCGLCHFCCPTGCIDDLGTYYGPNLDFCKGCGICAQVCPANAIFMVREVSA